MPRSREKGMKVGSWSQFLKTLPRKSRFHKGAGSRINAELLFGATGCPALLLWGWGVCYWRQGKQLSWSFTGYRLQRAVVEMTYPVLTVPPGACSRSTPVSVMGNNRARAGG